MVKITEYSGAEWWERWVGLQVEPSGLTTWFDVSHRVHTFCLEPWTGWLGLSVTVKLKILRLHLSFPEDCCDRLVMSALGFEDRGVRMAARVLCICYLC